MTIEALRAIFQQSGFSEISIRFAEFMLALSGAPNPAVFLACGLVSHRAEQGDVCLDLTEYAGKPLTPSPDAGEPALIAPPLEEWIAALHEWPVVGDPGEQKPLILTATTDRPRLYLFRYWQYENRIATCIRGSADRQAPALDSSLLKTGFERLFPGQDPERDDQVRAARAALENHFCVISGGPGTGKTTTVLKIIILLLEQSGEENLALALAAPTGKAANRLNESIRAALANDDWKKKIRPGWLGNIPSEATTIHRLLGSIRHSPRFRHDRHNPLPYDCVIVDEVSMVDLALMAKLVDALRPDSRLILLGDKNQLSSVESGSVLGDICDVPDTAEKLPAMAASIVNLRRSYRFDETSSIGKLSLAVNSGRAADAMEMLQDKKLEEIHWQELPQPAEMKTALRDTLADTLSPRAEAQDPSAAFQAVSRSGVICALRNGPFGSVTVNRCIDAWLREIKQIPADSEWYPGRPVMITRNDYQLDLYNGDIGIVLADPDDNDRLKVFFQQSANDFRKIAPARLPEHETAHAMTIHKSQGSEFDHVLLILPAQDVPVLSRELIYTGITRARKSVTIWSPPSVLTDAIHRRTRRSSGLNEALWVV